MNKKIEDKLKALEEELRANIEEIDPTFAEEQLIYSLKNYIDAKLKLLIENENILAE